MVEPNACIIINMQVHICNRQVEVINFHPKFMQIHGEMKEKEQVQISMHITSNFTKISKIFKDSWIWSLALHLEEKMDQEWIRSGSKTCWFEYSGEEVQFSGGMWLKTTPSLSEGGASLNAPIAQRTKASLSETAFICHAPDPTVQVISFHIYFP